MRKYFFILSGIGLLLCLISVLSSYSQNADGKNHLNQQEIDRNIKEWLKSPVQYIITSKESKTFKKLKDREEKIRFINYFWLRRDPNPKTLKNEYKEIFYRRVAESNEKFSTGFKKGWKTKRGQIYIVFGPPPEVVRGFTPDKYQYEVWRYYNLPDIRVLHALTINFIDWYGNNDYRISRENFLDDYPYEIMGSRRRQKPRVPDYDYLPMHVIDLLNRISKEAIVNKNIKLKDVPFSPELLSKLPFRFYKIPFLSPESKVHLLLGISFKYRDISFIESEKDKMSPSIAIQASLLDEKNNTIDSFHQKIAFYVNSEELEKMSDKFFFYWCDLTAQPGSYDLSIEAKDDTSGAQGSWKKPIALTSLEGEKLILSDIILADEIVTPETREPDEKSINTIWLMGHKIKPNMDREFRPDSKIYIFFQLKNFQLELPNNEPQVEIDCYITKEKKILKRTNIPYDSFILQNANLLLVSSYIPLYDLPADEYHLIVHAVDKMTNEDIYRSVKFNIIK
jgi:GWxTD domain-containing protein